MGVLRKRKNIGGGKWEYQQSPIDFFASAFVLELSPTVDSTHQSSQRIPQHPKSTSSSAEETGVSFLLSCEWTQTRGKHTSLRFIAYMREMSLKQHNGYRQMKPAVTYSGAVEEGAVGPSFGLVDIGASESGYLFRVSLPGVRCKRCHLKCNIERDGKVLIEGVISESELLKPSFKVYQMKQQGLCPPGPFTITFNLPGPVDPRLCSPSIRPDGILEVVVLKYRIPCLSAEGMFEKWEDSVPVHDTSRFPLIH